MANAYTTLTDVKNKLLKGLIRTSDSIYILGKHDSNVGSINLAFTGITMDPVYSGMHIRFEFRFDDAGNATHYHIYRQSSTEGSANMIYLTDGFTGVNKVVAGYFTLIAAAGWSGAANIAGLPGRMDIVILETDSQLSTVTAEAIGNDIECFIDEQLREKSIINMVEGTSIPADLYFQVHPPVPRMIKVATEYWWAFRLVDDIFRVSRQFDVIKQREDNDSPVSIAYGWLKEGAKAFAQYVRSRIIMSAGNAPRWVSQPPLQTTIGVPGVAMIESEKDVDYTDSTNSMSSVLDWYLNSPYVDLPTDE
jgi:hypothetical protein